MLTDPNLTMAQASMQTPHIHDAENAKCIDSKPVAYSYIHVPHLGTDNVQELGSNDQVGKRAI